ncbi:hypothetical protein AgCh_015917 [Apium graveolens]
MESQTHFMNTQFSHHPHNPATTYRHETTAISLLILLTLLTVATITYISTTTTKPPSLSTHADPVLLFNTSLYISLAELKNISALPQSLITESTDTRTVSALHDCEILFDDAVTQLNKSIKSLTVGPGAVVFTRTKIRELNVWISAAMTDQETCLDGLEEMGSTARNEVRMKVQLSKQCMSDSLAILAKIQPVDMLSRYLQ